ncbi:MAG: magnesium chelatase ATPase subunit I [Pyrinomonadaceae bacterium]|nr:magnesium chelatase ATPase subunit I [Pyrinomonadaceae bacterium]
MRTERPVYPFTAIVGQGEMKLGLLLNAIDPLIGGVLIMGHRGTGKSTAVRALADLLPHIWRVRDCLYSCDPGDEENLCAECASRLARGEKLSRERSRVAVVDLPLGATEDRVCGAINVERALTEGVKAFEPGLLARANRGFLYIDEVNLLEDHLVDLLLDTAATGRNKAERESVSVEHPARFVLVGSGNPEEGELRPQLLDRFGLHVEIKTIENLDERLLIVERCDLFERDAAGFLTAWEKEQDNLRRRITRARKAVSDVKISRDLLRRIAELCLRLKVDGHRGELTIARAARALAAFEGRREVTEKDIERVAVMSLRHRLRRDPLDRTPGSARIEQALEELFPSSEAKGANGRSARKHSEPDDFRDGANRGAGNEASGNGDGPHLDESAQSEQVEAGAEFDEDEAPQPNPGARPFAHSHSSRRQALKTKAAYNTRRGRYARASDKKTHGAKLALDATLRAMIGSRLKKENSPDFFLSPTPDALRYKLYKRKTGTLFIFAVDASGSMALNRIRQAKGALAHLLERSYVRRDQVALVSFRGEGAEVLLPPSRNAARARRLLDEIPVGGATPLASGLNAALQVARRASTGGAGRVVLFLFTDGRANISIEAPAIADKRLRRQAIQREIEELGHALLSERVSTVVVDTQAAFTSNGEGRALASALRAHYILLPGKGVDSTAQPFIESMNQSL